MVLPCLRGVIGDWVYYSTVMTAKQVAEWIMPAKDIREAKILDEVLQRDLKERKKDIAKYLLTQESRFFNSIIVGVFEGIPDWYEFKFGNHPRLELSEKEISYLKESIGFLTFNGDEKMFAIDGQHRVAGIEIAYSQDTKSKNPRLKDDQFSIIFLAHIDDKPGMKRTRKLFSDININAKPVAQGDRIKIDEESLSAIVTRKLYTSYSYFNEGNLISLTESAKLDEDDNENFTNLLGLFNTCKILRSLYKKAKNTHEWEEINAVGFYEVVEDFFNCITSGINDLRLFFIEKKLTIKSARAKNKYLLYRPIGLKLIAKIYVFYYKNNKIDSFLSDINKISFVFPDSPYDKILWNQGKMEVRGKNQKLAYQLSLYLLNNLQDIEVNDLLQIYREVLKNQEVELPEKILKATGEL